jgi:HSP20 family molecular chaperone IbpA/uncharacterized phage infection (PIP) family protein YhgE
MDLFGRKQIAVLAKELNDLHGQNLDLVEELKKRTKHSRDLEGQLNSLRSASAQASADLTKKVESLTTEVSETISKLKKESELKEKLEVNIRDLKISKEKKVKELNDLKETFDKQKSSWETLENQLKAKADEIAKLNAEKGTFDHQLETKNKDIIKLNSEKSELQAKVKQISAEAANDKKKLKDADQEVKKSQDLRSKLENEKKGLVGEKAKLEKDIEKLRNDASQGIIAEKAKIDALNAKINDLESVLAKLRAEQGEERKLFSSKEKDLEAKTESEKKKVSELTKKFEDIKKENDFIQAKLKDSENEIQKLLKQLDQEKNQEKSEILQFENTKKQFEEESKKVHQELNHVKDENSKKDSVINGLKNDAQSLDHKIKTLEQEIKSLKNEADKHVKESSEFAEERKKLQGKVFEYEKVLQENKELAKKIEEIQKEEKNVESGLSQKVHENDEIKKEKDALLKRVHELENTEKENNELKKKLKELQAAVDQKNALEVRVKELEVVCAELDALKEKLKKSDGGAVDKENIEKQFKELKTAYDEKEAILKSQSDKIQDLSTQLSNLTEENKYEYDFIINIDNFFDIADLSKGWELLTYDKSIIDHKQTTVCCILGQFDRGKTFLLDKLTINKFGAGKKLDTCGISFKDASIKEKFVVFADTPGYNSPLHPSSHDASDKKMTENFIQDLCYDLGQYFIIIVHDFSSKDQKLIQKLEKRLKDEKKIKEPCIIVVHNFKQVTSQEQHERAWHNQVISMLKDLRSSDPFSENVKLSVNGENHSVTLQIFRTKRVLHCSLVNDRSSYGSHFNLFTFEYIKSVLASGKVASQELHILNQLKKTVSSLIGNFETHLKPVESGPHQHNGQRFIVDISGDLEMFKSHILKSAKLNNFTPAVDRFEDDNKFFVVLDVPGVPHDAISVSLKEGFNRISGVRKENPVPGGKENERKFGEFSVEIKIPEEFEPAAQHKVLENGVLTLTYAKKGAKDGSSSSSSSDEE